MAQYSANINVMMKAVRKASRRLVRDFGEVENLQVSQKGPGDFVSAADLKAEETIIEELQEARPGYSFLLEESGEIKGDDEFRWIVDPLDGTTNFLHGFPNFCVSVALEQRMPNGKYEIVAAVTDVPMKQQTFWAEKGQGAWLETSSGTTRLRVAARKRLGESLICLGTLKNDLEFAEKLSRQVEGVRCLGATTLAMAYVAAGRFDCFCNNNPYLWDIAAGILLIKEAGGFISDVNGKDGNILEAKSIIAGSEVIQRAVLKAI